MIHVIASIRIRPGKLIEFLEIFRANVPKVLQEDGCIDYLPAVDVDASLPVQQLDAQVVTVIERWRDVAALHAHLQAPHMLQYKDRVKDLVEEVSLRVLEEA